MSFLSVLMVYASVNSLSVILGRFMNFLVEQEAEHIKCLPKGHQTLAPSESRTSDPVDTRLLLVLSAICSKNYSSYEKSLGKYIPPLDSAITQRVLYLFFNPQTSLQLHIQPKPKSS